MNERKMMFKMSILMGATMSFALTAIGLLSAGRFTVPGFMINFLISFCISMFLGLVLPVGRMKAWAAKKASCPPGSLKARVVDALVTALIYSPLMTFVMVSLAHRQAISHGADVPFWPMLMRSEFISIICAFLLGLATAPVYAKILFKDKRD